MKAWDEAWKTEAGRAIWLAGHPFVAECVARFREEGVRTVLDLGFGVGRHAIFFAKEGFQVSGIDPSPAGLAYAKDWARREGVDVTLGIGEMGALPFEDDCFDLILAWNVLYHGTAAEIRQAVAEIRRCLKPGGYLLATLISTRNAKHGLGNELEPGTFTIPGGGEKSHPHHYFDQNEIDRFFARFSFPHKEEAEQADPESWHWQLLARRSGLARKASDKSR